MQKIEKILKAHRLSFHDASRIEEICHKNFDTTHHSGAKAIVKIQSNIVHFQNFDYSMNHNEAIKMAKWILEMLGDEE